MNRILKRTICLAIAIVMLVTVLPAGTIMAADKAAFYVGNTSATAGETAVVPVGISNNTGFGAVVLKFTLPTGWTLSSITTSNGDQGTIIPNIGTDYMAMPNAAKNQFSLTGFMATSDITEDGILCWLTVSIPADAINGANTIGVTATSVYTLNEASNNIASQFDTTAGTITISGGVDVLTDSNTIFEDLEASYVYDDGKAIEPSFTVKYGDKTLTKDTDYTVSYENNTDVGTATVTVTGTGSYQGSASTTFEIVKKTGTISGTASYSKAYGDAAFTLDAVANSGAALSYNSDNGAVATVDAVGKVSVVGSGSAVIAVSAAETENYTKPVDFKVNVTVGKAGQTLTGETSYTKTYGDDAFDLNIGGAQGGLSYSSSKPSVATVDETGKVTVAGVGTTTITVTADEVAGKYNAATMSVTVTVEQKEVSVSGITVTDKVYDKTTAATVTSKGTINGMVEGDDLDINVTGTFANANAGENKNVNLTVSLTGTDAANYKLAADSQTSATATIEKAPVAVPTAKTGLVYNTKAQIGVEATADYTVVGGSATNADDYIATATLKDAANYKWADDAFNGTVAWSIAKAAAAPLTMAKSLRYSTTDMQTITIDEIRQMLNEPGEVVISGNAAQITPDGLLSHRSVGTEGVSFALRGDLTSADAGRSEDIEITVVSDNYETTTLTITLTVQDKIDVSEDIVFANGDADYTGRIQKYETATYNGSVDGITYNYSADPINVGTYSVTAIYEDADNYGEKTVSFRIDPVAVSVTGGVVVAKEYDTTTEAKLSKVNFSGLVNGESFSAADYTVTSAAFADANAGTNKRVTFAVELAATGTAANYVLTGSVPAAYGTINPKTIAITVDPIADQAFKGNAIKPAVAVNSTETLGGYVLAADKDYTVTYKDNTNVGTARAEITAKTGSNYTFSKEEVTFRITEAAAPAIADLAAEYTYNYSGNAALNIVGIPANAGTVSYAIGTLTGEAAMVSNVAAANGKVSFTVNAMDVSYVGKSVTIPVTVQMQNYADVEIEVVITRSEKDMPVPAVQSIEKTYDGVKLTDAAIRGTATFEGKVLSGTWSWVTDPAALVNANEIGYTAKVKFTPAEIAVYAEVEAEIKVVIKKADPTGQPSYTKIEEDGKTLADAKLTVGTIAPAGTIDWVDPDTTKVEQGTAYRWVFTPNDTTNYNTLTGTVTPYAKNNSWGAFIPVLGGAGGSIDSFGSIIDRFYDVNYGDWYADAVTMVVSEGLFEGTSYNYFEPNGTMTRAMLVTVLWRLAGQPVPYKASSFADVPSYEWYADAVAWAEQYGIVDGVSETSFAPNQSITREQMAVILHRYAKSLGYSGTQSADLSWYADGAKVSSYAEGAMSWAVAKGLISGMTETTLAPQGTATRAQVATILMRFVNYVL